MPQPPRRPYSAACGDVGCSVADKQEAITAYLSEEEQRQRIRELVCKQTGMDWPELTVGEFEKGMNSVTLFYWGTKEEVGKRWHEKRLELTDEEAESIGI